MRLGPAAILALLAASAASGVELGCSSRLPHPPYVQQPTSALVAVAFPPPPAKHEFVPAQPTSDAVWIDGEWVWRGRQYRWKPGRWVAVPAGALFSPWAQVRDREGNLYVAPGTWRNAANQDLPEPPALAVAASNSAEATGDASRP